MPADPVLLLEHICLHGYSRDADGGGCAGRLCGRDGHSAGPGAAAQRRRLVPRFLIGVLDGVARCLFAGQLACVLIGIVPGLQSGVPCCQFAGVQSRFLQGVQPGIVPGLQLGQFAGVELRLIECQLQRPKQPSEL